MPDRRTIFITGFPGFIANRLLERLARKDCDFILLVQPSLVSRALEEVQRLTQLSGRNVCDFQIVEGDISVPRLALSDVDLELVQQETTRVFHLAAVYDLAVPQDIAMRVNAGGTRNVVELARSIKNLRQFHHVSTCYVAGKREGVILETELKHNAGYRNFYEESKYLADRSRVSKERAADHDSPAVSCLWRLADRRDRKV